MLSFLIALYCFGCFLDRSHDLWFGESEQKTLTSFYPYSWTVSHEFEVCWASMPGPSVMILLIWTDCLGIMLCTCIMIPWIPSHTPKVWGFARLTVNWLMECNISIHVCHYVCHKSFRREILDFALSITFPLPWQPLPHPHSPPHNPAPWNNREKMHW